MRQRLLQCAASYTKLKPYLDCVPLVRNPNTAASITMLSTNCSTQLVDEHSYWRILHPLISFSNSFAHPPVPTQVHWFVDRLVTLCTWNIESRNEGILHITHNIALRMLHSSGASHRWHRQGHHLVSLCKSPHAQALARSRQKSVQKKSVLTVSAGSPATFIARARISKTYGPSLVTPP